MVDFRLMSTAAVTQYIYLGSIFVLPTDRKETALI